MAEGPIIQFDRVSIENRPPYEVGLEEVSFAAKTGELVLIAVEKGHPSLPLADAAEGLVTPNRGRVTFQGADWRSLKPDEGAEARGRIGRVFQPAGWISNLNVGENITLSQRHHTRRPEGEIYQEAEKLARDFGLPEMPKVRPVGLNAGNRRRAELIRAFLGETRLIILEDPMEGAYTELLPYLVKAVAAARDRGAAVLWITSDFRTLRPGLLAPSQHYQLKDTRLYPVKEKMSF